jgi:hypothetical protein
MRTTVTLDPDVDALVKKLMKERELTFKQAINEAIRMGFARDKRTSGFRTPTYDMGEPLIDLTKALQIAGEIEDQEIIRKMKLGM